MTTIDQLTDVRLHDPAALGRALADRTSGTLPPPGRKLLLIAADHPGRGALGARGDSGAMTDRADLLRRCQVALSRPGVGGFVGTADTVEDLALLGALEGHLVLGSINRSGLPGTVFEADDRCTAYDVAGIVGRGLDGGKLMLRIDPDDPASAAALERAGAAVSGLAAHGKVCLVEPFVAHREGGRLVNELTAEAMVLAVSVASALGNSSAYTWLKVPWVPQLERVLAATTLPCLVLGGEVPDDWGLALERFRQALRPAGARGLVVGRSVLYPRDGDVAAAVDRLVEVL